MPEPLPDPLLTELRRVAARADPVPPAVLAAAKASFTWRTLDAELAELTADSMLSAAGVRSAQAGRLLTFEAPGLEVEVEIGETGAARRLTGQLVPVGAAQVTVRWTGGAGGSGGSGGSAQVIADDMGRFTATGVPAGAVSLEIQRVASQPPVVTSWVLI